MGLLVIKIRKKLHAHEEEVDLHGHRQDPGEGGYYPCMHPKIGQAAHGLQCQDDQKAGPEAKADTINRGPSNALCQKGRAGLAENTKAVTV